MVKDPGHPDRRSSPRRPPQYTAAEIDRLRIERVHFREDYLFGLLSDGNVVCVPGVISPFLAKASAAARYRWQIRADGKAVVWYTQAMGAAQETLELRQILAHPQAQITEGSR